MTCSAPLQPASRSRPEGLVAAFARRFRFLQGISTIPEGDIKPEDDDSGISASNVHGSHAYRFGSSRYRHDQHHLHRTEIGPLSSRCVAKECRSMCGVIFFPIFARFSVTPQDQPKSSPRQLLPAIIEEKARAGLLPASLSMYARTAATADSPNGTIRSLSPLPIDRTTRSPDQWCPTSTPRARKLGVRSHTVLPASRGPEVPLARKRPVSPIAGRPPRT